MSEVQTANANEVGNIGDVLENLHKNHASMDMVDFARLYSESLQAEPRENVEQLAERVGKWLDERGALPQAYKDNKEKLLTWTRQKVVGLRNEYKEMCPGMTIQSLARMATAKGRPEVKSKRRHALADILGKFAVAEEKPAEGSPQTPAEGNEQNNNAA